MMNKNQPKYHFKYNLTFLRRFFNYSKLIIKLEQVNIAIDLASSMKAHPRKHNIIGLFQLFFHVKKLHD